MVVTIQHNPKLYLMTPRLTLSIMRYRSRVSGAIPEKEVAHFGVVAIQKGAFEAPPITLFTNPSAWPGYDTRSIFKRSLGFNSEFSFS